MLSACQTCKFWGIDIKDDHASCLRHAPSPLVVINSAKVDSYRIIQPLTHRAFWCGEWMSDASSGEEEMPFGIIMSRIGNIPRYGRRIISAAQHTEIDTIDKLLMFDPCEWQTRHGNGIGRKSADLIHDVLISAGLVPAWKRGS